MVACKTTDLNVDEHVLDFKKYCQNKYKNILVMKQNNKKSSYCYVQLNKLSIIKNTEDK